MHKWVHSIHTSVFTFLKFFLFFVLLPLPYVNNPVCSFQYSYNTVYLQAHNVTHIIVYKQYICMQSCLYIVIQNFGIVLQKGDHFSFFATCFSHSVAEFLSERGIGKETV